ncbi:MAG: hypothetical protein ACKOF3_12055 [Spartobacteria bacterium]
MDRLKLSAWIEGQGNRTVYWKYIDGARETGNRVAIFEKQGAGMSIAKGFIVQLLKLEGIRKVAFFLTTEFFPSHLPATNHRNFPAPRKPWQKSKNRFSRLTHSFFRPIGTPVACYCCSGGK